MHGAIYKTLQQCFPIVRSYATYIESFDTMWAFVLASKHIESLITGLAIDERLHARENLFWLAGFMMVRRICHLFSSEKDIRGYSKNRIIPL